MTLIDIYVGILMNLVGRRLEELGRYNVTRVNSGERVKCVKYMVKKRKRGR